MVWGGLTLRAYLPARLQADPVLTHGLASPIKYVRLVRRRINGQLRYAAQLICEGTAYQKPEHLLGVGIVGLDLGPSTVAVVSETEGRLQRFCGELAPQIAETRRLERHLDRQRRANNSENYLPNGQVKKGHKGCKHWRESVRQQKTQAGLAHRQRKVAAHRKGLHGRLAHQVVRMGSTFPLGEGLLPRVAAPVWTKHPTSCPRDVCAETDPSG